MAPARTGRRHTALRAATVSLVHTITIVIGNEAPAGFDWAELRGWGTLFAALIAASIAYRAFLRERRRDKIAAEIRLREQASRFSGWMIWTSEDHSFYLRNASDLPITDVNVRHWEGEPGQKVTFEQMMKDQWHADEFAVIAPGDTKRIDKQLYSAMGINVLNISITFTDAQGILWARHQGKLIPNPLEAKSQPLWYRAFEFEPLSLIEGVSTAITSILQPVFSRITATLNGAVGVATSVISSILQRRKK